MTCAEAEPTAASPSEGRLLYLALPYDGGQSGISTYIRATLGAFSARRALTVVCLAADAADLRACLQGDPAMHRLLPIADRWGHPLLSLLWFALWLPLWLRRLDVAAIFVPAGNRRCLFQRRLPQLTVVHDLAPLKLKRKYDPLRQLYTTRLLPAMLRLAGPLAAISRQTRDDLTRFTGCPADQIVLAPNGFDDRRFVATAAADDAEVLTRYGLGENQNRPYVLYVARIEHPGKNHLGLLQAWQALPAEIRHGHTLVCAGSDWKGAEQVHAWLAAEQAEQVRMLGFVPAQDLPALYRGAKLYVQPSLYEGFGLPLAEAMASGVPVLSANRGALPEVGGEAVAYFDPGQPDALTDALARLLTRPELRRDLADAGLLRAREFSWTRHSDQLLAALARQAGPLRLQGLPLFNGRLPQLLAEISRRVNSGRPQQLFFVNADCLNLAWSRRDYRQALQAADLLLPDGSGVALGARLTGQKLNENLNGTDLFVPLCELARRQDWGVWLLGGRPEVNAGLCREVTRRWPGLKLVGAHHGFFDAEQEAQICARIRQDRPQLLLVALGAPRQELWISRHAAQLGVPLMLGVGGLFDFYSGRIPRAPLWLRQLGLEWCWRLLQEPRRLWRRYLLGNPLFIWRMLRAGRQAPPVS